MSVAAVSTPQTPTLEAQVAELQSGLTTVQKALQTANEKIEELSKQLENLNKKREGDYEGKCMNCKKWVPIALESISSGEIETT